ncbi:MAG: nitronate monooxygenase [Myxococcales bacterium]|nr:nitronate monooxygenase [Myxococcales bacterium]
MGVGVSGWRLARAVAERGHLGVVSGVGCETLLARRLQDGDPDGVLRDAMAAFPIAGVADAMLRGYFRPEGRMADAPYRPVPLYHHAMSITRQQKLMLGAFVEVYLAKRGHRGAVGINLLTKIQLPTLPTLYGALLAGVDYVLMGAGIPREIPGVLDALAEHRRCTLRLDVEHAPVGRTYELAFDPAAHWSGEPPPLVRPRFLAIVASHALATMLARKATGRVDGFVVEGPTAGGHNAPPRGELRVDERGEPVYGPRDEVDLGVLRQLGLPFWLAGGAGHPGRLRAAQAAGAAGVQVGTLFALCDESGIAPALKRSLLAHAGRGEVAIRTDPRVSPTGYPFKIVTWPEDPSHGVVRERICDLGYLRTAYARADGSVGYRCPGEPIDAYLDKGGRREDTDGRRCLCNELTATVGLGQRRAGGAVEPPLVTSGDELSALAEFLGGRTQFGAGDVLTYLGA